jgi:hypothetical protein
VAGCACVVEIVAAKLPADKADAYRKAGKAYAAKQQAVAVWLDEPHPDPAAAKKQFEEDLEELKKLKVPMDEMTTKSPPQ